MPLTPLMPLMPLTPLLPLIMPLITDFALLELSVLFACSISILNGPFLRGPKDLFYGEEKPFIIIITSTMAE
jgi:hypothetical protein